MKRMLSAGIALWVLMPLAAFAAAAPSGPVKAAVQINGVALAGVQSLTGLKADIAYFQKHQKATGHTYGLTIAKTFSSGDATLSGWWKSGRTSAKSVTVIFNNNAGAEVARVNFSSCVPLKWTAPARTSAHATEKLQLRCTGINVGS